MDVNVINNSSPEKLRDFAAELNVYCSQIEAALNDLAKNHKGIGEHWQGAQYDQFTERFSELAKNLKQKLDELSELRNFVLKKAKDLEDAQGIGV